MEKRLGREIILVDTGILYAMSDKDDAWHERVKTFMESNGDTLVVASTVIPEVCYLINSYLGPDVEHKFINSLAAGEMRVEHFNNEDLKRILKLVKLYNDSNIGFVDASVVSIAERLKVDKILTTDRRHFSIIKPLHCNSFTLLP